MTDAMRRNTIVVNRVETRLDDGCGEGDSNIVKQSGPKRDVKYYR